MITLSIDMMGGDNGSKITIEAVQKFLLDYDDVSFLCVGDENELSVFKDNPRVKIIPSTSVVPMECSVMDAMRNKTSSVYLTVSSAKENNADGVISAGSTGAFLALSTLILKKIDGVERPALITPFPTKIPGKQVVLLDVGASSENSADDLVQFAKMGEAYYSCVFGEPKSLKLVCNGTEEGKGNTLCKEAYAKLKTNHLFKGYVEGRDVFSGDLDVAVMDGFTGNVLLKTAEGVAKMMAGMMRDMFTVNVSSKIGYLLSKKGVKQLKDRMDYKKVGGAFLIGVNSIPVKAHGNSDAMSFYYSIRIAYNLAKQDLINRIKVKLNEGN